MKRGLLLFPIFKDLNKADGILVKNDGIRKGFLKNGVAVDVLDFTSEGLFINEKKFYSFHSSRYVRSLQTIFGIWKPILKMICSNQYDFLWLRLSLHHILSGQSTSFVKRLKESCPSCKIILEYGAYPFAGELSKSQRILYSIMKGRERITHKYSDFAITYSGQKFVDNLINIPINNGIELDDLPVVHGELKEGESIHLISVSSLKKWHAYERILLGLHEYAKANTGREVHFNIVGNGPEYDKLNELAATFNLQDLVTFHNYLSGEKLDKVYAVNHIAIGTLGFHRIGITNSSSLKNREYMGRGLPIVLSTKDLDMPGELPFVKYVPEGETAIDISDIVSFAEAIYSNGELNKQIREYSEKNISWASKIKTVLRYLKGDI